MSEVMEKSVAARVQDALQQQLSTAEIDQLLGEVSSERRKLNVRAFELAQKPVTSGTPEDVAQRKIESLTLTAAQEQLTALARRLDGMKDKARKREAIRDRDKLTADMAKAFTKARKASEAAAEAWREATAAAGKLNSARSAAMGMHNPWPDAADTKHQQAAAEALEVWRPEWQFRNWDYTHAILWGDCREALGME